METVVIIVGLVLAGAVVLGVLEARKLRRENKEFREKLAGVEQHISSTVEERLVNHAKYCERVDALVKTQIAEEEVKWRELIEAATCRMREIITEGQQEMSAQQESDLAEVKRELDKQMMNFQALLKQSYLDEYEKMRTNPPRPKKGPRKKIDPPQRWRSLDDDFSYAPPPEPEKK